ncbi:polyprenol monophosphomannose synthase [Epidermidibacterium keratini]|uniref:polyprenol monophosphomannose synthase n=1 Tax=Epidermidibacterium keratini TaxID=1891644 RepID=UPI001CEFA8C2|nr:polyprenol monophosphomannose synthase [Epidermidibacterium keratini]
MRTIVVLPTYNEAASLRGVLGRLLGANPDIDVLVVDDGSPDGTGQIADEIASTDRRVHVLHRSAKTGLGDAYIDGFRWALAREYDVIGEMDADGSHQPEQLGRLRGAIEYADVVIGSRWVSGGTIKNWPRGREVLSRVGNIYIRRALGLRVRDVTAGYRLYRAGVLDTIELDGVVSHGYCFQTDLTRRAADAGFSIVEVPIDFVERELGESKMSGSIVTETLKNVTVWGLQRGARAVRRPRQR